MRMFRKLKARFAKKTNPDYEMMKDYCKADVELTAALYRSCPPLFDEDGYPVRYPYREVRIPPSLKGYAT